MRENVVEELRQMQSNDETKRKMLDILKRFHSDEEIESMDEDDSTVSEEIIQRILSGDQVNFDDLSAVEKKQFHRALASGELSKMIEPWDPWWLKPSARTISLSQEGTQLIQALDKQEASVVPQEDLEGNQSSEIPPGPESPLLPISKLSSTEPSPLLAVHLVDILYSYCFALRLYNGEWQSDAIGSAMVVLSVSSVLGQGRQPETVLEALSHCLEQICSPAYRHMGGLQLGLALVEDVISLLSLGGPALVCSLCDLQRLIQTGEKELKSEKPKKYTRVEIRSKLKLAGRKIYFMMCWVHEQPGEAWSSLAAILGAEKSSAVDYYGGSKQAVKTNNKEETRGKVLVEET
ncbi:zinc finger HIT domain-containing protein 2 isoform X3 [Juglans microcarpa x Juglans regia]|nr:zinc finger HIT domain-containing protein 2 isoform X3 [Juglans microcarpa x Juglans regia]